MALIIHTAQMDRNKKLPPDIANQVYNGLDVCVTHDVLAGLRKNHTDSAEVIYRRSMALQVPTVEASLRGIKVDRAKRNRLLGEAKTEYARLNIVWDKLCEGYFDHRVNWNSPKQVAELFYASTHLNCTEFKKRGTRGYILDTGEDGMMKVRVHPRARIFSKTLLGLRSLKKTVDFLELPLHNKEYYTYGINVAGTNSGRMSSAESDFGEGSNSQNVTKSLKEMFIADEGYKLGEFDLEQADSRNFGANCVEHLGPIIGHDEAAKYLNACESGDLHTLVTKLVWQDDLDWGTLSDREIADQIFFKELSYRDTSKGVGHGTNYLGGPAAISSQTQLPANIIEAFQSRYFEQFPCVPALQNWIIQQITTEGKLTNLFGRTRHFFGRPDDKNVRNEAVAFMGQSCTAEEINLALLALWALPLYKKGIIQFLVQVHDSLMFQYKEEYEAEVYHAVSEACRVKKVLAKGTPGEREFEVPLDFATGWNWGKWDKRNPDKNPNGMKGWNGSDDRTRKHSSLIRPYKSPVLKA